LSSFVAFVSSRVNPPARSSWPKGVERAILIVLRAEISQSRMRLGLDALRQCRGQARFADPWLAGNQHHPPFAGLRLPPAPQ
jgi:hypothetical protein